jgi:hypothetical protein
MCAAPGGKTLLLAHLLFGPSAGVTTASGLASTQNISDAHKEEPPGKACLGLGPLHRKTSGATCTAGQNDSRCAPTQPETLVMLRSQGKLTSNEVESRRRARLETILEEYVAPHARKHMKVSILHSPKHFLLLLCSPLQQKETC